MPRPLAYDVLQPLLCCATTTEFTPRFSRSLKWYGADKDNPPSYVQAGCQFNNSQSGWVNQRGSLKLRVSTPPEHCSYKHNPTYQTGLYETSERPFQPKRKVHTTFARRETTANDTLCAAAAAAAVVPAQNGAD